MIVKAIAKLLQKENLSRVEAEGVFRQIMEGQATDAQIGAYLIAQRLIGETADEIYGAAKVMREKATGVSTQKGSLVDTCGTGGDGSGTFNVSTASAIVAAGAGVAIAKHGNRSVSSKSGSADVLKELGVNLNITPEQAGHCVDEVGIGFLFAPLLHGAMKHAIGPRKEIAQRSIFNLLGPLTNPAGAKRQVMGVFDEALTEPLARVLGDLGAEHVWVVYGLEGIDEISVVGPTKVSEYKMGEMKTFTLEPQNYGLQHTSQVGLKAEDASESAAKIQSVLSGDLGAARDIVVLNAAAAILVSGQVDSFESAIEKAKDSIDQKAASAVLEQLISTTKKFEAN